MACNDVVQTSGDYKEDTEVKQIEGDDKEKSDDIDIKKALKNIKISVLDSNDDDKSKNEYIFQRMNPPKTPESEDDDEEENDDDTKDEFEGFSISKKTTNIEDFENIPALIEDITSKNKKLADELIKNVENGHNELINYVNKRKDILLNEINVIKDENDAKFSKLLNLNERIKSSKASTNPNDDCDINALIEEAMTCYKQMNDGIAFKMTLCFDDSKLKKTIDQKFKLQSENQEDVEDDFKEQEHVQYSVSETFYNNQNSQSQRGYYDHHRTNNDYYYGMQNDEYSSYRHQPKYERKRGRKRGRRDREHYDNCYRDEYVEYGANSRDWRSKRGRGQKKAMRYYNEYDAFNQHTFREEDFAQINAFVCSQQPREIGHNNGSLGDVDDYQSKIEDGLSKKDTKTRWKPKKQMNGDIHQSNEKPKKHHIYVHDTEELDYSSIKHKYADIVIISQFDGNHISNNGLTLEANRTILKRTENQTHGYAILSGKPAINGKHCWRVKCEKFKPWIFIGVCNPSCRFTDSSWNNKGVWGITTCSQSNRNGNWSTDYSVSRALEWKKKDLLHLDMMIDCDCGRLIFKEISENEQIEDPVIVTLDGLRRGVPWVPHFNLHTFGSTVTARKIPAKRFGQVW